MTTDTAALRSLLAEARDHRWDRDDFDGDMPRHQAGYFESHAKTCDELDALRNAAPGMCDEIDLLRRKANAFDALATREVLINNACGPNWEGHWTATRPEPLLKQFMDTDLLTAIERALAKEPTP